MPGQIGIPGREGLPIAIPADEKGGIQTPSNQSPNSQFPSTFRQTLEGSGLGLSRDSNFANTTPSLTANQLNDSLYVSDAISKAQTGRGTLIVGEQGIGANATIIGPGGLAIREGKAGAAVPGTSPIAQALQGILQPAQGGEKGEKGAEDTTKLAFVGKGQSGLTDTLTPTGKKGSTTPTEGTSTGAICWAARRSANRQMQQRRTG